MSGDNVKGSFYAQELQHVELPKTFTIEKTLHQERRQGKLWYFVKWRGYPETFNSWIPESDVT